VVRNWARCGPFFWASPSSLSGRLQARYLGRRVHHRMDFWSTSTAPRRRGSRACPVSVLTLSTSGSLRQRRLAPSTGGTVLCRGRRHTFLPAPSSCRNTNTNTNTNDTGGGRGGGGLHSFRTTLALWARPGPRHDSRTTPISFDPPASEAGGRVDAIRLPPCHHPCASVSGPSGPLVSGDAGRVKWVATGDESLVERARGVGDVAGGGVASGRGRAPLPLRSRRHTSRCASDKSFVEREKIQIQVQNILVTQVKPATSC
jgi:hypothetical protein